MSPCHLLVGSTKTSRPGNGMEKTFCLRVELLKELSKSDWSPRGVYNSELLRVKGTALHGTVPSAGKTMDYLEGETNERDENVGSFGISVHCVVVENIILTEWIARLMHYVRILPA